MAEAPVETRVDIRRILEICRDIEIYASKLYYYYAELYSDTPDISGLWKKTAMEEENHAHQFVLAINLLRQGIIHSVAVDLQASESTLSSFKSFYKNVKQNKPALVDALNHSIKLEEKLSEFHLSNFALFQEESHKKLFEAMMKNDRGHVTELENAYNKVMADRLDSQ